MNIDTPIDRELRGRAIRIGVGIMSVIAANTGLMGACIAVAIGATPAAFAAISIGATMAGFIAGSVVMAGASIAAIDAASAASRDNVVNIDSRIEEKTITLHAEAA